LLEIDFSCKSGTQPRWFLLRKWSLKSDDTNKTSR
jgi:hypothetical protein